MKKLTIEELTKVVETLFGKIECIEILMKEKNLLYKKNDRAKNGLKLEKCISNFNKRDLAQFFYILMDEKILFFDAKAENSNRSKMQHFVQTNFTYVGDSKMQINIENISKQFSESKGFTYRDKQ
ncbi:hypothetical protein [Flavobacterium sp. DSP2-3-1]|uniref:hypothetical protein n=1 Tax=unclassified Flavobacterium TaxID=196869 RepID=UPI003CEBB199